MKQLGVRVGRLEHGRAKREGLCATIGDLPALYPPSPLPAHEPESIAGRVVQVLPQPQVALGGLDGGVAERDLDLLERHPALVGELGEGAPQVMRRDLAETGPVAVPNDGLEDLYPAQS